MFRKAKIAKGRAANESQAGSALRRMFCLYFKVAVGHLGLFKVDPGRRNHSSKQRYAKDLQAPFKIFSATTQLC